MILIFKEMDLVQKNRTVGQGTGVRLTTRVHLKVAYGHVDF